jgi:hypothetical protein
LQWETKHRTLTQKFNAFVNGEHEELKLHAAQVEECSQEQDEEAMRLKEAHEDAVSHLKKQHNTEKERNAKQHKKELARMQTNLQGLWVKAEKKHRDELLRVQARQNGGLLATKFDVQLESLEQMCREEKAARRRRSIEAALSRRVADNKA